jgi:hypothetical protein
LRQKHIAILGLTLGIAVLALWLEPTRVVWGWLRGEAFYQGRPTSYWRQELALWQPHCIGGDSTGHTWSKIYDYYREKTFIEKLLSNFVTVAEHNWPSLLEGDPLALSLLKELSLDSDAEIRKLAGEGLARQHNQSRGSRIVVTEFFP